MGSGLSGNCHLMMNFLWPIGGTSQLSFWNPLAEGTVALGGKAPQPRVRVGTQHVPQGPGRPAPSAHGGAGPVQGGLARCVHSRWGQKGLAQQWVWQIAGTGPWGGGDAFEITMFLSRQELALRALRGPVGPQIANGGQGTVRKCPLVSLWSPIFLT